MGNLTNKLPYLIFIFLCLFFSFFEIFFFDDHKNKLNTSLSKIFLFILISYLMLLCITRNVSVGNDTLNYSNEYYLKTQNKTFISYVKINFPEVFFYGINYLFSQVLKVNEIFFRIFFYSIEGLFLYLAFRNDDRKIIKLVLIMLIVLFGMSLTGFRQSVAISISIFAISLYNKNNKIFPYFLLILFAVTIHASALILFVLPLLKFVKVNNKNYIFIIFLIIFIIPFIPYLVNFLLNLFDTYYNLESGSIGITPIIVVVFLISLYVLECFLSKFEFIKTLIDTNFFEKIKKYYVQTCAFVLFAFLTLASPGFARFSLFFLCSFIELLVICVDSIRIKWLKRTAFLVLIVFFSAYFYLQLGSYGVVPYKFFW